MESKILAVSLDYLEQYQGSISDLLNDLNGATDDPDTIESVTDEMNVTGAVVYALGIGVGRKKPTKETAA